MTYEVFENDLMLTSALGGSTGTDVASVPQAPLGVRSASRHTIAPRHARGGTGRLTASCANLCSKSECLRYSEH